MGSLPLAKARILGPLRLPFRRIFSRFWCRSLFCSCSPQAPEKAALAQGGFTPRQRGEVGFIKDAILYLQYYIILEYIIRYYITLCYVILYDTFLYCMLPSPSVPKVRENHVRLAMVRGLSYG